MTPPWVLERGATVRPDGTTRFTVWAPNAMRVSVCLRTADGVAVHSLAAAGRGVFTGILPGVGPGSRYWYRLDDARDRPDPVSRFQPEGVHGPSAVVDPAAFAWTDAAWHGRAVADFVIYELHVGTFTPAGTFAGVIDRLPYLRDLGITAVELMPIAAFPGRRNWGYDGACLYAPHEAYGGPDALRQLADAAHAYGLAVILDVVYNHLGPEANTLGDFGPYFTDRYRTPWGAAINFDGPDSDEVRRYVIDNARYWVSEFHIDGLRLDAVHAIVDMGACHIVAELAAAVRAQGDTLGRRVVVIAESDLNDPCLVRPPARGGYGLDAQWNDDFHHAVHAVLTGERHGYYVDYGGTDQVAKALRHRFVLDGCFSTFRRRRHGAPATDMPGDRFVVAIQTHDQVGNRAGGERLDALVSLEARKLAAALLLLSPYVPLLFMGEEYGETRPFFYFVDHGDAELLAAVRAGRRREFAAFAWAGAAPDPGSPDTCARSMLSWDCDCGPRRALHTLYRDLLATRHREPALRPGAAQATVASEAPTLVTLRLTPSPGQGAPLLAAFNLGAESVPAPALWRSWTTVLATADPRYGGPAAPGPVLSGWSAVLYREES